MSEEFPSAFYELYLFGLFEAVGISMDPIYDEKKRIPDFIANVNDGFYIEATISVDDHHRNIGRHRIKSELFDYLNETLKDPDFLISVNLLELSSKNPKMKIVKGKIENWLNQIRKKDDLNSENEVSKNHLLIESKGWKLLIHAIPIKQTIKDNPKNIIGSIFQGFSFDNSKDKLRHTIMSKANHYKSLNKPLLLAINMLTFNCDLMDIMDALFGDTVIEIPKDREGPPTASRIYNGAWFENGKFRNRRISALLITNHLNPWSIAYQDVIVVHHPKPHYPLDKSSFPFKQKYFQAGRLCDIDGLHPRKILNLKKGWPE